MIASEKQGIQRLLCFSCSAKDSAGIERNRFSYYSCKQKISKHEREQKENHSEKRTQTLI